MKRLLFTSAALLALGACNSSDSEGSNLTVPDNAITEALDSLDEAMEEMGNLEPGSSKNLAHSSVRKSTRGLEFDNLWTDALFPNPEDWGGDPISAKEWMGLQLDEAAVGGEDGEWRISPLGRMQENFGIFCAIGVGLGADNVDENGYPNVTGETPLTITITSDVRSLMQSFCGVDPGAEAIGASLEMVVTDVSEGGSYDRKMVMTHNFSDCESETTQTFYAKKTDSLIRIASVESNCHGFGRLIASQDSETSVTKFEYISGPEAELGANTNATFQRVYYDASASEGKGHGYIVSRDYSNYDGPVRAETGTSYVVAGMPNASDNNISLSMMSTYFNSKRIDPSFEACVDAETGDISDDGARCIASDTDLNGYDVVDATAFQNIVTYYNNWWEDCADGNTVGLLDFNDGDIHTGDWECQGAIPPRVAVSK